MMVPPGHLIGTLRRGDPRVADRADWIMEARAAGLSRAAIAAALRISTRTVHDAIVGRIGKVGRNPGPANAARLEKLRERRHGAVNGVTYSELHAAGLTAVEAASRRGESRVTAKAWAADTGNVWPDGRSTERARAFHRAFLQEVNDRRRAGFAAMVRDPARCRTAAMTEPQREDYAVLRRAGISAPDALRSIGRPDLIERPPLAAADRRASPEDQKRAGELRRIRHDPEGYLAERMARDAAAVRARMKAERKIDRAEARL